jgi:hypothetical protein
MRAAAAGVSGVLSGVTTNRGGESLAHQALLYGSEEEFRGHGPVHSEWPGAW